MSKVINYRQKKLDRKIAIKVEHDLKSYPFWIIRLDCSGLGIPSKHIVNGNSICVGSSVEYTAEMDEQLKRKVAAIEGTCDLLREEAKKVIDYRYFKEYTIKEVLEETNISKTLYYNIINDSLVKFAQALGYTK